MAKNSTSVKNPFKIMYKGTSALKKDGMHRPEGAGNFDIMEDTPSFKEILIQSMLSGKVGSPVIIGDPTTTPISVNAENELLVAGKFEVQGNARFDGGATFTTSNLNPADGIAIAFGTNLDATIAYQNENTPDTLVIGTSSDSNNVLFAEAADRAFDFAHAQQTNPTIYIHSANQSTTEHVGITHDQTDGIISTGSGNLTLEPADDVTTTKRLGVGTTSPGQKLVVQENQNADTFIRVTNATAGTASRAGLQITTSGSENGYVLLNSASYTGVADHADAMVIGVDGSLDGGIVLHSADKVRMQNTAGTDVLTVTGGNVLAGTADSWALPNETSSATNPTLIPDRTELGTGIGGTGNNLSLINTGTEILKVAGSGIVISGTIIGSGVLSIDSTIESSSATTGSIHTDGGLGIAKKLFVGTDASVSGTFLSTGVATLADASVLASDAAPTADAQIANKKYVDDQAGSDNISNITKVKRTNGNLTTTSVTFVDATGMTATFTTGANRVLICVQANGKNSGANDGIAIDIDIDGTREGGDQGQVYATPTGASEYVDLSFSFLTDALTAASHTFKIMFRRGGGGTAELTAGSGRPLTLSLFEIID